MYEYFNSSHGLVKLQRQVDTLIIDITYFMKGNRHGPSFHRYAVADS